MTSLPRRSVVTKPQWRRQARWVLTRGWGWPTAATSWPTERSPSSSSSSIWSLVGSPRTLKKRAAAAALAGARTVKYISGIVAEAGTGRILGATVVADGAGDVIQAAVYAVQFGLTTDQVASTWAPYLTFAEGFKLAAQTFRRDVSKLSCCAA